MSRKHIPYHNPNLEEAYQYIIHHSCQFNAADNVECTEPGYHADYLYIGCTLTSNPETGTYRAADSSDYVRFIENVEKQFRRPELTADSLSAGEVLIRIFSPVRGTAEFHCMQTTLLNAFVEGETLKSYLKQLEREEKDPYVLIPYDDLYDLFCTHAGMDFMDIDGEPQLDEEDIEMISDYTVYFVHDIRFYPPKKNGYLFASRYTCRIYFEEFLNVITSMDRQGYVIMPVLNNQMNSESTQLNLEWACHMCSEDDTFLLNADGMPFLMTLPDFFDPDDVWDDDMDEDDESDDVPSGKPLS